MLYLMVYKKTPYQHEKNHHMKMVAIQQGYDIKFNGIDDPHLLDCLQVRKRRFFEEVGNLKFNKLLTRVMGGHPRESRRRGNFLEFYQKSVKNSQFSGQF